MSPKKEKENINNEDFEAAEYFSRVHPLCDGCGDEIWNVDLIECPGARANKSVRKINVNKRRTVVEVHDDLHGEIGKFALLTTCGFTC